MADAKTVVKVTTGPAEMLPATITLFKDAFATDPVLTYFINTISSAEKRQLKIERLLRALVGAGAINDAVFYYGQQGDYPNSDTKSAPAGCRGVLMTKPRALDSTSTLIKTAFNGSSLKLAAATGVFPLLRKMLIQYQQQTHRCKKGVLKEGEKYYYMYWLATDAKERGKGLASAVVREMQDRARRDNVPLWTEGSSPRSARLYASMGFETVEIFRAGKGEADEAGLPKAGGEGVPVAAMVWREGCKGWAD